MYYERAAKLEKIYETKKNEYAKTMNDYQADLKAAIAVRKIIDDERNQLEEVNNGAFDRAFNR